MSTNVTPTPTLIPIADPRGPDVTMPRGITPSDALDAVDAAASPEHVITHDMVTRHGFVFTGRTFTARAYTREAMARAPGATPDQCWHALKYLQRHIAPIHLFGRGRGAVWVYVDSASQEEVFAEAVRAEGERQGIYRIGSANHDAQHVLQRAGSAHLLDYQVVNRNDLIQHLQTIQSQATAALTGLGVTTP